MLHLCFLMDPPKESLFLWYKAFPRPLLTYALPGWFPFLSITNVTKLEHLHLTASGAIIGWLSTPIPLLLSEMTLPPLRVTLTRFIQSSYKRALCLPTSFHISGLARLGVKSRLSRSSWRAFGSITHLCFFLLLLGGFSLLELSPCLKPTFLHCGADYFYLIYSP